MTTQILVKSCDGGHVCHPPKECCKQGCCYLPDYNVYKPPVIPTGNMFNPLFLGHWYFWAAITATLAGIVCACSLWKRHNNSSGCWFLCCRDSGRDERTSQPDSTGSCYAPPQYSRCSSFHQAPPPYSEVASKPDLYPLVISYNGEPIIKNNGQSTGYLMVQYFRNFIVRPVGSLSATSTIDSLSSSFICNATNEANSIIPPPYSCTGSLEEVNSINNHSVVTQIPVSTTSNDLRQQQPKTSPSVHSYATSTNFVCTSSTSSNKPEVTSSNKGLATTMGNKSDNFQSSTIQQQQVVVNKKLHINGGIVKNSSVDSESQEDDHNFSDLLNLSVCLPSSVIHLPSGMQSNAIHEQNYSVTNSMTSSDISSLANLGTPDSPPRATSPTVEMRELLDKIQQLPQHKSPPLIPETPFHQPRMKLYFNRTKAKTLYMPLQNGTNNVFQTKISPKTNCSSSCGIFSRTSWLSRSAPNTPCGNFVPSFSVPKKPGSHKGSKVKINKDGSPLLRTNKEDSDEDNQSLKDERL
ncbi:uncharacterized protein [Onthophagus taurus]|uniref:uncharacterized protein n=1 Tax=Onthophagus taurus TaxID=166361 RepID=UPI0039BDE14B